MPTKPSTVALTPAGQRPVRAIVGAYKKMKEPPPLPSAGKSNRARPFLIAGGIIVVLLAITGIILGIRFIREYGITEPLDRKFGDQNLKSTIALLELHKVRFGKYPDSLGDLKYLGDWDQIWLSATRYYPSADRQRYYVEVERGWIGKPTLVMPEEFWKNTGYDVKLKPKKD